MKYSEFNAKRSELNIQGTGVDTVTFAERTWTNRSTGEKTVIPVGSHVHVYFGGWCHDLLYIVYDDKALKSHIALAHTWLRKFKKCPSMASLARQSNDGICVTATGYRVEPDGFGPDGSPSWLMAMGVI